MGASICVGCGGAQTCFFATHYVADGGVMVFVDLKKYGLDQTEIDFIETKVKAMD
jgi:hypothetical protein